MLTYLHPVTGGAVLLLLVWAGTLGLRARNQPRHRRRLLALHARWAPVAFWLMLATWVAGVATTWWLRHDIEVGETTHFAIGNVLVAVLVGAWLTAQRMDHRTVRELHPWFGVAALLLSAAQVFFGLQITP